jgi:hypothetical protein
MESVQVLHIMVTVVFAFFHLLVCHGIVRVNVLVSVLSDEQCPVHKKDRIENNVHKIKVK